MSDKVDDILVMAGEANNRMSRYFVIVTCRNSQSEIENALLSLQNQTIQPSYVIVIDDGSTDKTPAVLRKLQESWPSLYVMTNPDLGYDIGRVVNNWNLAITFARENNLPVCDYHMIATDDTVYKPDYAEKILMYMKEDDKVGVASGEYGDEKHITPHGAGRFIRTSFFDRLNLYPEKMGYESAILHLCGFYGYTYNVFADARFEHIRPLGKNHHFSEFGASMRTLGYHPLYVLGRTALYLARGKPIGRLGAVYMLYHYLFFRAKRHGYYSLFDEKFRRAIKRQQGELIKRRLLGRKRNWK